MRIIMQNDDTYTGRTAADVIEAHRASNRWDDGSAPKPLDAWMAATLKIWKANGYTVPDRVDSPDAFLRVMVSVGLVRKVYENAPDSRRFAGLGSLGAAENGGVPSDLTAWTPAGDRWIVELKDGRAYHLWKTTRGWKVSVGYDHGGPGHTFLDADGAPSGGRALADAPAHADWPIAIRAARANAHRYAKA